MAQAAPGAFWHGASVIASLAPAQVSFSRLAPSPSNYQIHLRRSERNWVCRSKKEEWWWRTVARCYFDSAEIKRATDQQKPDLKSGAVFHCYFKGALCVSTGVLSRLLFHTCSRYSSDIIYWYSDLSTRRTIIYSGPTDTI